MRNLLLLCLLIGQVGIAQTYSVHISDEIKRTEKNSSFDILGSDSEYVYYSETWTDQHAVLGFGRDFDYGVKLICADKDLHVVYTKDYAKELKDYSYLKFAMVDDEIFLLAQQYFKKENTHKYYIAKINKETGEMENSFVEFGKSVVQSLMNSMSTYFIAGTGGRGFLYAVQETGGGDDSYQCSYIDKDLTNPVQFSVKIPNSSGYFLFEDIQYAGNGLFVITISDFKPSPQNKKEMVSTGPVFYVYDVKKRSLRKMDMALPDKQISLARSFFNKAGEFFICGNYTSLAKNDSSKGYCIMKADLQANRMNLVSSLETTSLTFSKGYIDDATIDAAEGTIKKFVKGGKKAMEEDNVPGDLRVGAIEISSIDGSFTFIAEYNRHFTVYGGTTDNGKMDRYASFSSSYSHFYISGDLVIIHADKDGKILWNKSIPKSQYENVVSGNPYAAGSKTIHYPLYSSFSSLQVKNKLYLLFNDHSRNTENKTPGEKVLAACDFESQSKAYIITLDLASGASSRKAVFTNDKNTLLLSGQASFSPTGFLIPIPNINEEKKKPDYRIAYVEVKD